MINLSLVKSENFGQIKCDFWKNESSEIFVTREQIGFALDYSNPMIAIYKIHERHKDRFEKFSLTKLVNGHETYFYSTKGIYEICRWSRQPKSDAFMDWVWDVIEGIRTGEFELSSKAKVRSMEAEARLINSRTRQTKILLDAIKAAKGTATKDMVDKLLCSIIEVSSGKVVLNNTEMESKLRKFVEHKLSVLEQELGTLSKALVENMLMDYQKEFDAGRMMPEVYRAFSVELHKRLDVLN